MTQIRRAIIIAAGRGRRLGPHTEEVPKCMVRVGQRPILEWQWRALARAGIEELVMIRGYLADTLTELARGIVPNVTFVDNAEWESNNILLSLAKARAFLDEPTLVSYSDILFSPEVARAAATHSSELGLVIDRDFRDIYHGRTEHPLEEAEVAKVDARGVVSAVGKRALPPEHADGEFIGLMRLGRHGARAVGDAIDALTARYAGRDHEPFQRAKTYRNAYMTDLLQELIDQRTPPLPEPIWIAGQWREIDTGQDLARAVDLVSSAAKEWT